MKVTLDLDMKLYVYASIQICLCNPDLYMKYIGLDLSKDSYNDMNWIQSNLSWILKLFCNY